MNIPNLPISPIIDLKTGYPTDVESLFRQQLVNVLQSNAGANGLVVPTVTPAQLTLITNQQSTTGQYLCALGTLVYVQGAHFGSDYLAIAFRADDNYPNSAPIFKTVTVT